MSPLYRGLQYIYTSLPRSRVFSCLCQSYHIDQASPDLRGTLNNVLHGRSTKLHENFEEGDFLWLVEYLDRVHYRHLIPPYPQTSTVGPQRFQPLQPHFQEMLSHPFNREGFADDWDPQWSRGLHQTFERGRRDLPQ